MLTRDLFCSRSLLLCVPCRALFFSVYPLMLSSSPLTSKVVVLHCAEDRDNSLIRTMATPPASPPPPPPAVASASPSTLKQTRKATQLRSLATRPPGANKLVVHVDPATSKADGPYKKKIKNIFGDCRRDIRDLEGSPCCLEGFDMRNLISLKLLTTIGERWRQFKSDLTRKWALVADKDGVDDTVCEKYGINKEKWAQFCQTCKDPSMCRKRHRPSKSKTPPLTCYLVGMTSEAAKEIAEKIASQGSFVPHGHQDLLTAAIERLQHSSCVRATGAGVTIKQYFGPAEWTSRTSSSIAPEELEQLTQQIRDQLEESITEKFQLQSQIQSQGVALPPELEVGPSAARISTKGNCVDPSATDLDTGDSDKCRLYIEENPSCLVALGRVYEGSTIIDNIHLLHDQVKIKDVDVPIPVPTNEVILVGQTLNTFLAWPSHLVKRLSEHGAVSPAKPTDRPDPEVMWDASLFRLLNSNFPLYIKHEDLSEIAHGGQCLSISVIQLWIMHLTETSMRLGNSNVYGLLEPQSIQRFGQSQFELESYMKNWMQSSKRDVYLGAYLNGALKGVDGTPQPKSKAAVGARWIVVKCNKQKGSTKCGYYVIHWLSTIISGSFRNNWEMTIGIRHIEGISHPVGKLLSQS
ncbi:hypothetical protein HKD37_11G031865 [Glycine soja]